ncbi:MAG: ribonuclease D [Hyphomicrobiaceae bacterium]
MWLSITNRDNIGHLLLEISPSNAIIRDKTDWLGYTAGNMQVITDTAALEAACSRLAKADFATIDTEFLREQTFWPQLCLIQMAGPDGEYIVDPLADGIDLAPFWLLMSDNSVVKVFHAARQDLEIIYSMSGGNMAAPVFDTQVAAMVCGFGDSISYVNLVKQITGANLDKSSRFTDWSRRPLSDKQLNYAMGDVTHLREVYLSLKSELEKNDRATWLDEEMSTLTSPKTYQSPPEEAWRRLKLRVKNRKSLSVLIELAAWRETLAQKQDIPRGRVLRDEALYDIANQMPTETEKLSELRTLSNGFARSARAKEIVAAVRQGLDRDMTTLPEIKRGKALTPEATATLELLKVLLKASAAQHRVATRLIADASDLERLASEKKPDVSALKGWRLKLFGEDALRLKRGELALTLSGSDVKAIPVKDLG